MFDLGLSLDKLVIVLVIALILIGPERLPRYAAQLGRMVRALRDLANGAKDRMREEMGPEFDEVEWSKLDPRQYDPRRIVREALADSDPEPDYGDAAAVARDSDEKPRIVASAYEARRQRDLADGPAPYDAEAT